MRSIPGPFHTYLSGSHVHMPMHSPTIPIFTGFFPDSISRTTLLSLKFAPTYPTPFLKADWGRLHSMSKGPMMQIQSIHDFDHPCTASPECPVQHRSQDLCHSFAINLYMLKASMCIWPCVSWR